MVILIMLMVFVFYNDIVRILQQIEILFHVSLVPFRV